jgi:hypothetical protein
LRLALLKFRRAVASAPAAHEVKKHPSASLIN